MNPHRDEMGKMLNLPWTQPWTIEHFDRNGRKHFVVTIYSNEHHSRPPFKRPILTREEDEVFESAVLRALAGLEFL